MGHLSNMGGGLAVLGRIQTGVKKTPADEFPPGLFVSFFSFLWHLKILGNLFHVNIINT